MGKKRPQTVNVHLRLPAELHAKLVAAAWASNNPINTEMRLRLELSFAAADRTLQAEQERQDAAQFTKALKQRLAAGNHRGPTVEEIARRIAALEAKAKRDSAQHNQRITTLEALLEQIESKVPLTSKAAPQ